MSTFSLRSIIDDIMLMIRNNNISESEDFSRDLIAVWILSYKDLLLKKKADEDKKGSSDDDNDDSSLDSMRETKGPILLINDTPIGDTGLYRRRTEEKLPSLVDNSERNIISVCDEEGCPIQYMHDKRRHFHYHRRYTFADLVCWYENGYLYVEGLQDFGHLKYVFVTGIWDDSADSDDDTSEDDIKIPGWMVPEIKKMIIDNELSFMLRLPSDDDNNSTLDGIKPQSIGQQQINEK